MGRPRGISIPGPGTVSVNASLSKTVRFSETRTFEMRATASNVFNTVQYSGVDSTVGRQPMVRSPPPPACVNSHSTPAIGFREDQFG